MEYILFRLVQVRCTSSIIQECSDNQEAPFIIIVRFQRAFLPFKITLNCREIVQVTDSGEAAMSKWKFAQAPVKSVCFFNDLLPQSEDLKRLIYSCFVFAMQCIAFGLWVGEPNAMQDMSRHPHHSIYITV